MPRTRLRKLRYHRRGPHPDKRLVDKGNSVFKRLRSRISLKKLIEVTVIVIGIIGTYVSVIGYWSPRIGVQPLSSTNPKDALSTEFVVTNQGALSVYDVEVGCGFNNFIVNAPNFPGKDIYEFVPLNSSYEKLESGQSTTIKIPFSIKDKFNLDIEIVIYYRPAWYPVKRRTAFRFVSKTAPDGQVQWLPRPNIPPPQDGHSWPDDEAK